MSIKESARIAQSNNFMGLICRSSLLVRVSTPMCLLPTLFPFLAHYALWSSTNTELLWLLQNVVPALVETIKELGLVLVADTSDEVEPSGYKEALGAANAMGVAEWAYRMPDGVNGAMKANGILRFNDMIDM